MSRTTLYHQTGATLIICLIVLVVASSLAIYGARTAQNDMRLSTNQQDRAIALQRAENALRIAEERLEGFDVHYPIIQAIQAVEGNNPPVNGFASLNNSDNWWSDPQQNWNARRFPADTNATTQTSVYTIEFIDDFRPSESKGSSSGTPPSVFVFRIIGRGTGPGGSEAFLQSTYNLMRSL